MKAIDRRTVVAGGITLLGMGVTRAAQAQVKPKLRFSAAFTEQDLRHRLDIACIEFVELLNMRQDLAEVGRHAVHFFVRQPQIGEICDIANFFIG